MLVIENLSCGYGGAPVVRDISFTLSEGQRLAVLGPNGCGKTTLLRGIMGILPSTGVISLDGRDLRTMSARERGRETAMLTQMSSAGFSYTVLETVLMGRYAHLQRGFFSAPRDKDLEIAEQCLRRMELWEERDRMITELSGGQLQRVLLARTFAQSPRVILLDEPTNHLDLKYQVELVEELKEWTAGEGRAAIGVFHDIDLALSFADTVLIMEHGSAAPPVRAESLDPRELGRVFGVDVCEYMLRSRKRWERLGG